MFRDIILWLMGVPIVVIILLHLSLIHISEPTRPY